MQGSTGFALLIAIGAITLLYSGFKGYDPRSVITSVFSGRSPTLLPNTTKPPTTPTTEPMTGGSPGPVQRTHSSGGTPAIQRILLALNIIPGWNIISICGPGSIPNSEHPHCNAVDIGGSRAVLFIVQSFLLAGARSGTLPIHCIIGPNANLNTKGTIRSRESKWKGSTYTGPNSHQTHIHVSGWPSVGGGC